MKVAKALAYWKQCVQFVCVKSSFEPVFYCIKPAVDNFVASDFATVMPIVFIVYTLHKTIQPCVIYLPFVLWVRGLNLHQCVLIS